MRDDLNLCILRMLEGIFRLKRPKCIQTGVSSRLNLFSGILDCACAVSVSSARVLSHMSDGKLIFGDFKGTDTFYLSLFS